MKRNITAVYIRGLAFKASSGGRREQVLRALKKRDERVEPPYVIAIPLSAIAGFVAGYALAGYLAL